MERLQKVKGLTPFGKLLVKHALGHGMTNQKQLAKKLKRSTPHVSSVLRGKTKPTQDFVEQCCINLLLTKLQCNELIELAAEENGFVKFK